MPAESEGPKQEPLLSFCARWSKTFRRETNGSQKTEFRTAKSEDEEEDPDSSPSSDHITGAGTSNTSRQIGVRRQTSRAATKLKTKALSVSRRITRASMRSHSVMEDDFANQRACALQVANLFPDISPQHLQETAVSLGYDAAAVINFIADELEAGRPYPKKTSGPGKRKRANENEDDDEVNEEMARVKRRFDSADRRAVKKSEKHVLFISKLIIRDFPFASPKYVQDLLTKNDQLLLPTYLELEETIRGWDTLPIKPWTKNFAAASLRGVSQRQEAELERAIANPRLQPPYQEELEEMKAARLVRSLRDKMRKGRNDGSQQGEPEDGPSKATEELTECQCCFDEQPMARMVHCDGEEVHFFCTTCARRNAETAVGLSRHELSCMAMDSCNAGFSHLQRKKFLDKKLATALDRIEANHILSVASLENLEKCPFCNYAAEYPPVEENKVFDCLDKNCLKRSCRLCHKEDHLPQTCEEFAKENGMNARREIEEARSEAVIRRCNKCNNPFIKEMGCNKMTCPVASCKNVQCYICSKSCSYDHFSRSTGCVLYDNIESRHDGDLEKAEEAARKKILQDNPDITQEQLNIEMSAKVRNDDDKRRSKDAYQAGDAEIYWDDFRNRGPPRGRNIAPVWNPPFAAAPADPWEFQPPPQAIFERVGMPPGAAPPLANPGANQPQNQAANGGNHQQHLGRAWQVFGAPLMGGGAAPGNNQPGQPPAGPVAQPNQPNQPNPPRPQAVQQGLAAQRPRRGPVQADQGAGLPQERPDPAQAPQQQGRTGLQRMVDVARRVRNPAAGPSEQPRTRAEARRHREQAHDAQGQSQNQQVRQLQTPQNKAPWNQPQAVPRKEHQAKHQRPNRDRPAANFPEAAAAVASIGAPQAYQPIPGLLPPQQANRPLPMAPTRGMGLQEMLVDRNGYVARWLRAQPLAVADPVDWIDNMLGAPNELQARARNNFDAARMLGNPPRPDQTQGGAGGV